MGINVVLDEKLVAEAKRLTGLADDSAAVEQLLKQLTVAKRRPLDAMLDLAGTNPIRDDYDYKALRAGGDDDDRR